MEIFAIFFGYNARKYPTVGATGAEFTTSTERTKRVSFPLGHIT